MNNHERFQKSLSYQAVDRVPYFESEIRKKVLWRWHKEGLASLKQLRRDFPVDPYTEIEPLWAPLPAVNHWSDRQDLLNKLRARVYFKNPLRLPSEWFQLRKSAFHRQEIRLLVVHQGFFLTLGVYDWTSFDEWIERIRDDRELVQAWLEIYGEFAAEMAYKISSKIKIDAALFDEPIGGSNGPLLSPAMYREFALRSYRPVLDVLQRQQVPVIIFRTYANTRVLLPEILNAGMNCLWAYESNSPGMDYREVRREFGRDLRLIGGIDLDALRHGPEAIRREIEEKVPLLLADGGYIPAADGRIREDVSYANYICYRELLRKYIHF